MGMQSLYNGDDDFLFGLGLNFDFFLWPFRKVCIVEARQRCSISPWKRFYRSSFRNSWQ
jgi:hypothetical protein